MDARHMGFLDASFDTVTSFFTLMYIDGRDHEQVFREALRVLRPHGRFLVWDAALPRQLDTTKDAVVVQLRLRLPREELVTSYGTWWPDTEHNLAYSERLARRVGFTVASGRDGGRVFWLELRKAGAG
jgi:ubiquinone/menaquinone biosynthesis C-methylase UbiE